MEGLLIAEQLARLEGGYPYARSAWTFPSERTAVLALAGGLILRIDSGQDDPRLSVTRGRTAPRGSALTPFQRQLAARAGGDLLGAEQLALDRVVHFRFGAFGGFVPEPPVTLVAELAGRNANLVLLDPSGKILGVERTVTSDRNRFRQLRPGVRYVPPPPYQKLDPRRASREELGRALTGRRLSDVRRVVDGVGPRLQATVEMLVGGRLATDTGTATGDRALGEPAGGRAADVVLEAEALEVVIEVLLELVARPSDLVAGARAGEAVPARQGHDRERLETDVRAALEDALALARRRLGDAQRASALGDEPARLRHEADLMLASAGTWSVHGDRARLTGLAGEPVELVVDPRLGAAGNAQLRYDRARRAEARRERAVARLPELSAEVDRLERVVASLPDTAVGDLRALLSELEKDRKSGPRGRRGGGEQPVGVRFTGPHGLEVVVGRNARENDAVTFKVARSRDVWLHAQGYRGAHVVIRSGGGAVPFESVLFAARLAAGFSEARGSSNVPVDYTERKNVWRVKGASPGAVHYTQQKTVYVDPARDEAGAAGGLTRDQPT